MTQSHSSSLSSQIPVPSIFSEATKSLTIVIPAYNEEARLPSTLDETLRCNPDSQCLGPTVQLPLFPLESCAQCCNAPLHVNCKVLTLHQLTESPVLWPVNVRGRVAAHETMPQCNSLHRYLQKRRDRQGPSFTYEVIVVDDGSRDATVRKAFEYVRKHGIDAVRVLQLPRNYGKVCAALAHLPPLDTPQLYPCALGAPPLSHMSHNPPKSFHFATSKCAATPL